MSRRRTMDVRSDYPLGAPRSAVRSTGNVAVGCLGGLLVVSWAGLGWAAAGALLLLAGCVAGVAGFFADGPGGRPVSRPPPPDDGDPEAMLAEMIEQMTLVAVQGYDADGTICYWNQANHRLYGYSHAEAIGRNIVDLIIPPTLRDSARRKIADWADGAPLDPPAAYELVHKNGHRVPVLSSHVRLIRPDGRALMFCIDVDLKPLREAESARQKARREMQLILETTGEMFARYDRDLRIQWANRISAESVGSSAEQLIGRYCYEVWHGRDERCEDCPVVAAMQIGQPQQSEVQTPDGRWFDLRAYPLRDKQGQINGAIEYGADISARKQAEQALRESAQRCEQLASSRQALLREMDHRVKNSLAGLNTLVDICARSSGSVEQFAGLMHEKIDAMRLVHGLIMDQRGEQGDLESLVKQVIREFGTATGLPEVGYQGPSLHLGARQAGPMVMVLHELFTNARKYGALSGEAGRIELTWRVMDMGSDGQRIGLSWLETGGPGVDGKPEPGVGLGLIEGFARYELRGECHFDFQSDGLRFELQCTLDGDR